MNNETKIQKLAEIIARTEELITDLKRQRYGRAERVTVVNSNIEHMEMILLNAKTQLIDLEYEDLNKEVNKEE